MKLKLLIITILAQLPLAAKSMPIERLMAHQIPLVSFNKTPYPNALEFIREKFADAFHAQLGQYRSMTFEFRFDPRDRIQHELRRPDITYEKENITLQQLFEDVLTHFDLTYKIISIDRIAIFSVEDPLAKLPEELTMPTDSKPFFVHRTIVDAWGHKANDGIYCFAIDHEGVVGPFFLSKYT